MAYMMRNGVDFEVDLGSHIGVLRGDGAGRQTSARGKGWHGSGGAREVANAKSCLTLTLSPNVNKCFIESPNVVYCSWQPIVVTVVNSVHRQVHLHITSHIRRAKEIRWNT